MIFYLIGPCAKKTHYFYLIGTCVKDKRLILFARTMHTYEKRLFLYDRIMLKKYLYMIGPCVKKNHFYLLGPCAKKKKKKIILIW